MKKKQSAKDLLVESALELLSHGDAENITVTEIAKNCGVSTRTFYNNFRDKWDLFLYIYTRELDSYFEENKDHLTFYPFLMRGGQILWDYLDFFKHFQKYHGQNNFRDSVYQPLMDYLERIIRECFHEEVTQDTRDALSFFVHGMLGYISYSYTLPELEEYESAVPKFAKYAPEQLKKYM